jgi:hypothetical protein
MILKKLEVISRFLVKTEFKKSKYNDLQNSPKCRMLKSIGFNENQAIFNENRTGRSYLIPSLMARVLCRQHLMLMIRPQSLF